MYKIVKGKLRKNDKDLFCPFGDGNAKCGEHCPFFNMFEINKEVRVELQCSYHIQMFDITRNKK